MRPDKDPRGRRRGGGRVAVEGERDAQFLACRRKIDKPISVNIGPSDFRVLCMVGNRVWRDGEALCKLAHGRLEHRVVAPPRPRKPAVHHIVVAVPIHVNHPQSVDLGVRPGPRKNGKRTSKIVNPAPRPGVGNPKRACRCGRENYRVDAKVPQIPVGQRPDPCGRIVCRSRRDGRGWNGRLWSAWLETMGCGEEEEEGEEGEEGFHLCDVEEVKFLEEKCVSLSDFDYCGGL